ncbi:MAG TPA: hypothetical protein VK588_08080, partial [Chitinophagaceae bacterium]|nr:hypothetical protein [Chitinophagaceae bacterium]
MEVNKPLKINNGKYYVVLVLFAVIVYWPLSLNILSLKNDAITYFLPWRYHVSESLQHGYFPFWSPYLYTGLPIHADIQSGVWNPVVFMVSLFTTYDMNVLQWETVLYILIAGIGFFKLSHFFFPDKKLCLLLSMSYMCCGFMIDSGSFIAWVTSAAYVPFVFLFFLRTLQLPSLDSSLKLAIASSLLFLAGYTSFFIITFYLLFLLFIVLIIRSLKDRNKKYVFRLSI